MKNSARHIRLRRFAMLTSALVGMGMALTVSALPIGPQRTPPARPRCEANLNQLMQYSRAYLGCLEHAPHVTYRVGGRSYSIANIDRCIALQRRFETYKRQFQGCLAQRRGSASSGSGRWHLDTGRSADSQPGHNSRPAIRHW